jgi:capsular exopolysaccharide synthesis family protein
MTPDRPTPVERPGRLDVLLAGTIPPNPVELLESKRMVELLDIADGIYDIVILDTPPIGVVSDAIPLVRRVDGVVVISRVGVSRRDHATRLMKRVRGLGANVLGVVANGLKSSPEGYYEYYAYSDGSVDSPRRRLARNKAPH